MIMNNQIIKIFLASSSELKEDREQFEIFINRKNKEYIKKGIFLELILWEDFIDAMSANRLQDKYNKAITECDIVVSLFKTKVGQYTEEEVMTAWETFKKKNKPLIFTFFKDFTISGSQINLEHLQSLQDFKNKLNNLGHFYTTYNSIEDLKLKFGDQLIKLIPKLTNREVKSEERVESIQLEECILPIDSGIKVTPNKVKELSLAQRLKKENLETRLARYQSDYQALERNYQEAGDGDEQNRLQAKLDRKFKEIEQIENELNQLRNGLESPISVPKTQLDRPTFIKNVCRVIENQLDRVDFRDEIQLKLKKLTRQDNDEFTERDDIYRVPDLFTQNAQIVWILGEPGVGKKTSLLKLAKMYLDRSREQDDIKLPAYFDLSRWSQRQTSFYDWLIKELYKIYRIENPQAISYLNETCNILFFDGLDQMEYPKQLKCVEAISKFFEHNNKTDIVITCLIQKEIMRTERFLPEQTIYFQVQLLDTEQIENYLNRLRDTGNTNQQGLRDLLKKNRVIADLARTPLMLNIMAKIYIDDTNNTEDETERRQQFIKQFINSYVVESYKKCRKDYTQKQMSHWLSWVSKNIEHTSTFFIDEIQPTCLTETQSKIYKNLVIWANGILFGFLFGVCYGTILHYYLVYLSPGTESSLTRGILIGLSQGFISGLVYSCSQKAYEDEIKTYVPLNEFSWQQYYKHTINNLRSRKKIIAPIATGITVFLVCLLLMPTFLQYKFSEALLTGMIAGPYFGIVSIISQNVKSSFIKKRNPSETIDEKSRANQGIRDLFNLILRVAIVSASTIYLFYIIFLMILGEMRIPMLILGFCLALVTGLLAAIINTAGLSYRLHYFLRLVLVIDGDIPLNYAKFLDDVTNINLMRRLGGGYEFSHHLIKEYFRKLNHNQLLHVATQNKIHSDPQ